MNVSSSGPYDKANIFIGLIEYGLNSLLDASHLVRYISVHIRFDFKRYLLSILQTACCYTEMTLKICLVVLRRFSNQPRMRQMISESQRRNSLFHWQAYYFKQIATYTPKRC